MQMWQVAEPSGVVFFVIFINYRVTAEADSMYFVTDRRHSENWSKVQCPKKVWNLVQ